MFYKIKIKLIKFLNFLLKYFNLHIDSSVTKDEILTLINLMKVKDLGYNLIRIGSDNDGGYLVPDILDQIDSCFSPGVEKFMNSKNIWLKKINLYLADGTIEKSSIEIENFNFIKKNLSSKMTRMKLH